MLKHGECQFAFPEKANNSFYINILELAMESAYLPEPGNRDVKRRIFILLGGQVGENAPASIRYFLPSSFKL